MSIAVSPATTYALSCTCRSTIPSVYTPKQTSYLRFFSAEAHHPQRGSRSQSNTQVTPPQKQYLPGREPHTYYKPKKQFHSNSKSHTNNHRPTNSSSPLRLSSTPSFPSTLLPTNFRTLTATTTTTSKMSDEEYAKFLEKADNDASAASKTSSKGKKGGFTTNSVDAEVPAVLKKVDRYYVSDSDERFEVVSLSLSGSGGGGGNVGAGVFKQVSGHGNAEALDVKEFDPQGEYKDVVDAVKEAGNGKVEIFRADLGGARCEYWLISIDDKGNRVVGFRVGAVES